MLTDEPLALIPIINIINKYILNIINNNLLYAFKDLSDQSKNSKNGDLAKLDEHIYEQSKNTILTYIRVRCDQEADYNKRFDVKINKEKNNSLLLKYNDHDIKFYDKIKDNFKLSTELIEEVKQSKAKKLKQSQEVIINSESINEKKLELKLKILNFIEKNKNEIIKLNELEGLENAEIVELIITNPTLIDKIIEANEIKKDIDKIKEATEIKTDLDKLKLIEEKLELKTKILKSIDQIKRANEIKENINEEKLNERKTALEEIILAFIKKTDINPGLKSNVLFDSIIENPTLIDGIEGANEIKENIDELKLIKKKLELKTKILAFIEKNKNVINEFKSNPKLENEEIYESIITEANEIEENIGKLKLITGNNESTHIISATAAGGANEDVQDYSINYSDYYDINEENKIINAIKVKKYDYEYLLGPFTKVFGSDKDITNKFISNNMIEVINKLRLGKPVFIMGYGASGAGKTSSLIYFNKKNEDGILINLCNILATTDQYLTIDVCTYEFYQDDQNTSEISIKTRRVPPKGTRKYIKFNYNNAVETFTMSEEYKHTNLFVDRVDKNLEETTFGTSTTLGQFVIHLIDKDRYVKATTNNPNSSRSHTIIVIKFFKDNKSGPILIIGDFAGVENEFACENFNVLSAFSNIKSDNDKDITADGDIKRFYSVYPKGIVKNVEKVKIVKNVKNMSGGDNKICDAAKNDQDLLYLPGKTMDVDITTLKAIKQYTELTNVENLKTLFNSDTNIWNKFHEYEDSIIETIFGNKSEIMVDIIDKTSLSPQDIIKKIVNFKDEYMSYTAITKLIQNYKGLITSISKTYTESLQNIKLYNKNICNEKIGHYIHKYMTENTENNIFDLTNNTITNKINKNKKRKDKTVTDSDMRWHIEELLNDFFTDKDSTEEDKEPIEIGTLNKIINNNLFISTLTQEINGFKMSLIKIINEFFKVNKINYNIYNDHGNTDKYEFTNYKKNYKKIYKNGLNFLTVIDKETNKEDYDLFLKHYFIEPVNTLNTPDIIDKKFKFTQELIKTLISKKIIEQDDHINEFLNHENINLFKTEIYKKDFNHLDSNKFFYIDKSEDKIDLSSSIYPEKSAAITTTTKTNTFQNIGDTWETQIEDWNISEDISEEYIKTIDEKLYIIKPLLAKLINTSYSNLKKIDLTVLKEEDFKEKYNDDKFFEITNLKDGMSNKTVLLILLNIIRVTDDYTARLNTYLSSLITVEKIIIFQFTKPGAVGTFKYEINASDYNKFFNFKIMDFNFNKIKKVIAEDSSNTYTYKNYNDKNNVFGIDYIKNNIIYERVDDKFSTSIDGYFKKNIIFNYFIDKKYYKDTDTKLKLDIQNKGTDVFKYLFILFYELNDIRISEKLQPITSSNNPDIVLSQLYDFFEETMSKAVCRIRETQEICKIRRMEGRMINSSLNDTRTVISYIMQEKNKNTITPIPPFINVCLEKYCEYNGCFKKEKIENNNISGIIFKTIITEINKFKITELILCVFCLLNISYGASNPPPVPYLDINLLKKQYNELIYDSSSFDKFKNQLLFIMDKIDNKFGLKTSELKIQDYYNNLKSLINDKGNLANKDRLASILKLTNKFINGINKFNAASTMGTLEYMDNLSKYLSTNTYCKIEEEDKQFINPNYIDVISVENTNYKTDEIKPKVRKYIKKEQPKEQPKEDSTEDENKDIKENILDTLIKIQKTNMYDDTELKASDIEFIKNKLNQLNNNDEYDGGAGLNFDQIKPLIELYRNQLINFKLNSNVLRLSSFTSTEFIDTLSSITFMSNENIVPNEYIIAALIKYFYIDISEIISKLYTDFNINQNKLIGPSFLGDPIFNIFNNIYNNIKTDTVNYKNIQTQFEEKYTDFAKELVARDNKTMSADEKAAKAAAEGKPAEVATGKAAATAVKSAANSSNAVFSKLSPNTAYVSVDIFINILGKILSDNVDNTIKTIFAKKIIRYIYNIIKTGTLDILNDVLKLLNDTSNTDIYNKFKNVLYNKSKKNILTYLRIRCDSINQNPQISSYSRRFDIKINSTESTLNVKYNDEDVAYYTKTASDKVDLTDAYKVLHPNTKSILDNNFTYNHNYIFGPFTRIFPPLQDKRIVDNKTVGENLPEILDALKEGNAIFIIGYGASGSGKTSSLIYFNKTKENGILMCLCNKLAQSGQEQRKWDSLTLKAYEFYDLNNELITKKVPKTGEGIEFRYDTIKGTFVSKKPYNHENTFLDRIIGNVKKITPFPQDTDFGNLLTHIIDTDRYVKATTNNPNSSRSHALIVVEFKSTLLDAKNPVLIIGDFAGVENKFTCDKPETLELFANIRENNNNNEDLFYSKYNSAIPQSGGTECAEYIKTKNPIYRVGKDKRRLIDDTNKEKIVSKYFSDDKQYHEIEKTIQDYVKNNNNNNKDIFFAFRNNKNKFIENNNSILEILSINNKIKNGIAQSILSKEEIIELKTNIIHNLFRINSKINNNSSSIKEDKNITANFNEYINIINSKIKKHDRKNKKEYFDLIRNSKEVEIQKEKYINLSGKYYNKIKNEIILKFIDSSISPNIISEFKFLSFESLYYGGTTSQKKTSGIVQKIQEPEIQKPAFYEKTELIPLIEVLVSIKEYIINNNLFYYLFDNITREDIDKIIPANIIQFILNILDKNFNTKLENIATNITEFKQCLGIIYDNTGELLIEEECRLKNIENICKIRTDEGIMINSTLASNRNFIAKLIQDRNKDSISLIPPFEDICINSYLIGNSIFEKPIVDSTSSEIFKIIKGAVGNRYDELIICVFCLLNISHMANNPPPSPYIDINSLKHNYYSYEKNNNNNNSEKLLEVKENIKKTIETILRNKTKEIIDSDTYKEFKNDTSINKTIYNNFIKQIDTINAASAIGTLEFVDSLSKYFTTKEICTIPVSEKLSEYTDVLDMPYKKSGGKLKIRNKKIRKYKKPDLKIASQFTFF
jgi:hypothetical protein